MQGLEEYVNGLYDVVLMDIEMPLMNGIQCTKHIREYEKDSGLDPALIICISGNARDTYKTEAFAAGVNSYIVKPFNRTELLTLVASSSQQAKPNDDVR